MDPLLRGRHGHHLHRGDERVRPQSGRGPGDGEWAQCGTAVRADCLQRLTTGFTAWSDTIAMLDSCDLSRTEVLVSRRKVSDGDVEKEIAVERQVHTGATKAVTAQFCAPVRECKIRQQNSWGTDMDGRLSEPDDGVDEAVRLDLQQQVVHGDVHHPLPQQEGPVRGQDPQVSALHLLPRVHGYVPLSP